MPLNDATIRQAKPGAKAYKLSDAKGLHLLINPIGSKLWRWQYRFAGKQKMLALGAYPEISLKEARQKRDNARRLLEDGRDPSIERKQAKREAKMRAQNSLEVVARRWIKSSCLSLDAGLHEVRNAAA